MTVALDTNRDLALLSQAIHACLRSNLASAPSIAADALVYKLCIVRVPYTSSTPISAFHAAMASSHAVFYQGNTRTHMAASSPPYWQHSTLILLFQRSCKDGSKWLAICGIKAIESSSGRGPCEQPHDALRLHPCCDAISYIQYIDTTGYTQPRELQSRLTRGLLTGYYRFLAEKGLPGRRHCQWLAWYATGHENASRHTGPGQPSSAGDSLFWTGSHQNPLKRPLHGASVSAWWSRWIDSLSLAPHQVWSYSPGSEDLPADAFDMHSNPSRWQNGQLPFAMNGLALPLIPLLPDDPMTRHLEALEAATPLVASAATPCRSFLSLQRQKSRLTVRELMASLAFRSEYRHGAGTHYYIRLNHRSPPEASLAAEVLDQSASTFTEENGAVMWSLDDWISSTARTLDFSSMERAQESSQKLLKDISGLKFTQEQGSLLIQELNFFDLARVAQKHATDVDQIEKTPTVALCSTNDIQGLVKRKKL